MRTSDSVGRMSVLRADVAVVGAAGMAAALAAADLGAQVVLVDAGAAMGGQIYRPPTTAGAVAGPSVGPKLPQRLRRAVGHPRIRHLPGTTVWQAIKVTDGVDDASGVRRGWWGWRGGVQALADGGGRLGGGRAR